MKKQFVSLGTVLFWLISLFLTLVSPTLAQDWQGLSPDIDGDGLLNDLETTGWYNEAGGPFVTDALDADSDDDGLTDGEEKLYDTIPVNEPGDLNGTRSPGIYIRYEDSFYTKEYFRVADPAYLAMKQAGDRYLMTEAMVMRRGTTFRVNGPSNASLTISGDGLTELTEGNGRIQKDPCRGGWLVSLPLGGTVGTYTATMSLDGWQKEMPIYVIFELPTPTAPSLPLEKTLTQEGITSFLYDDDPSNVRDETAIIWYTGYAWAYSHRCDEPNDPPCYDKKDFYHHAYGWSQAFFTEQYKKYIFLDKVIWRIHGETSQWNAADVLSEGADQEVRVDYNNFGGGIPGQPLSYQISYVLDRYFDGTGETQTGTACHSQAGAFSAFLRSAGIPAQAFITDWWGSQYDTSVRVWLNEEWYAARSYTGGENGNDTWAKYYPFSRGPDGHTYQRHLRDWDTYGNYRESNSHLLVTANEGWDWQMVNTGSVGDDTTKPNREYKWDSISPLEIQEKHPYIDTLNAIVWQGEHGEGSWPNGYWSTDGTPEGWPDAYDLDEHPNYPDGPFNENWPIEPVPQACPSGFTGDCPYPPGGGLGATSMSLGALDMEDEPTLDTLPQIPQAQSDRVQFGPVVNDYGVDPDGNGRFDELVIDVEVTASQPGYYTIGGLLALPGALIPYGGIYANSISIYLSEGTQTIHLAFDGLGIGSYEVNGPYQVAGLWITDFEGFDPRLGSWDEVLASQQPSYATHPYMVDQFETSGASLADRYSHYGVDDDGDGRYETVVIDVTLDISTPGTYQVEGNLYNDQGDFVGHATWSDSDSVASLKFGLEKTTPPYKLEDLRLYDANDVPLDARSKDVYPITDLNSQVDQGTVTMDLYLPPPGGGIGILGETITPTHVFSDSGIDLDDDDLYDQLVIDVQVDVSEANQYRVEGWLEGPDGSLMVYAISDPVSLDTGLQSLSLAFDGRAINGRGLDGPYTVVALKILDGTNYDVLDEVEKTGLELNYNASDFEPASEVASALSDDLENGTANWTWDNPPWNLNESVWHSSSHAWRADESGLLTTIPLDLSNYANPTLRIATCYNMQSPDDVGYLEVSNGLDWTTVATYTNSTLHWQTVLLGSELRSFYNTPNLQLRFNANSQNGLLWYIDDVYLNAWPDDDSDGLSNEEEDLNGNGIPNDDDTDNDGTPNYLDEDDDGDGVPTVDEDRNGDGNPANDHSDSDTIPDYLDDDDDGDGIPTADEDPNGDGDPTNDDTDDDGTPNYLDDDDDGDGTPTADEDGDSDSDTVPDYLEPDNEDVDNDGQDNQHDPDDDDDGVPTANEDPSGDGNPTNDDTDSDGTPNYLDDDDDGDGILTANEDPNGDGNPTNDDTDGDGTPDYLDRDDDGDGIYTDYENPDPNVDHNPDDAQNTDGDELPDYLDRDDDGDGIYTDYENPDPNVDHNPDDAQDTDGDTAPDYLDDDDDGDGINTNDERPDPNGDHNPDDSRNADGDAGVPDITSDNLPDYLDPDDDGDGTNTNEESTEDSDGDSVPDYLDPSERTDDDEDGTDTIVEDWNGDGDPTNDDADNDRVPDYMDSTVNSAPVSGIFLPIILRQ
jgi:hypothetical protein